MTTATQVDDIGRHAPALLFVTDARGDTVWVNDRWLTLLGARLPELLGAGWKSFVHADDIGQVEQRFAGAIRDGEPFREEFRLRHADGAYRWLEVRAEPERDERGTIRRWFGTGNDVDAQRRAMDALQLLAESGATASSASDVEALLQGVTRAALAGLADIAFFDLIDGDGWSRRVGAGAAGVSNEAIETTLRFPTRSGEAHPISRAMTQAQAIHVARVDEDYITCAVEDPARRDAWRSVGIHSLIVAPMTVGERRLGALTMLRTINDRAFEASDVRVVEEVARRAAVAVENIRLTEAARRESSAREQQFRAVADAMPLLMWTAGADGRTDWHNKRWHDYSGVDADGPMGRGWLTLHPDDMEATRAAWRAARESGEMLEMHHRLRRADGAYRWFLTRATPERDANGTIVRWYGTHVDIDDARRAERTLQVFSELGPVVSATLELQATLDAVLRVIVPEFADWASIHLADESGELHAAAAYDGERESPSAQINREGLVVPLETRGAPRGTLNVGMRDASHGFGRDDVAFFQEFARRVAPAIANAELFERERRVARTFQDAALPPTLTDVPACSFSAIYEAGRAEALVGGDWYDAFPLPDGRIVLSIGDVAGSGLQAAVTMASMRQAIRGVAYVHPDPVLMLEAADLALRSESPDRFVTAFVAVIDPIEDTLSFTTAGHPPPLIRTPAGNLFELEASGLPIGLRERDATPSAALAVEPGSLIVLFTDGLVESTHSIDEGYRRLHRALHDPDILDSPEIATRIRDSVLSDGSRDDVAILCARYAGVALPRYGIDVQRPRESARLRALILAELERCGYGGDAVANAEIVIAELIGNLVRHAPGIVTFVVEPRPGHVRLHVLDDGPGYRFLSRLPSDAFSERGRGLFLISALAEAFQVTPRPFGGSHATLTFATAAHIVSGADTPHSSRALARTDWVASAKPKRATVSSRSSVKIVHSE